MKTEKLTKIQINRINKIGATLFEKAKKYARNKGFDSTLDGLCAITSGWAFDALEKAKIKSEILITEDGVGGSHVFVLINKTYIFDIAYRQFNHKVKNFVFIHKNEIDDLYFEYCGDWFWNIKKSKIVSSKDLLIKKQKKDKWCSEQIAF